jgi:y4mF family transcriptional regulator
MGFTKTIGKAIKERRGTLGITQRELAEIAGVGINTLTKIERGEANPALKTLQSILDALGLEIKIGVRQ